MTIGSIEESISNKLKLHELPQNQHIMALLQYLQSIFHEDIKSSPPELKGLLSLLSLYLDKDPQELIKKYMQSHEMTMQVFFKNNKQRFDRFEFKPILQRLQGIEPGQAYEVPRFAARNFERMRPIDQRPYIQILEADPNKAQSARQQLAYSNTIERDAEIDALRVRIADRFSTLQAKIKEKLPQGKDAVAQELQVLTEQFVPALQMKYNKDKVDALFEGLCSMERVDFHEIFESLKIPLGMRERFVDSLEKHL